MKNVQLPRILDCYIRGELTGAKMFEIIAQCSLYLDYLTAKQRLIISRKNWWIFDFSLNNAGKECICLRRFGKTAEENRVQFLNLIKQENSKRKNNKIQFNENNIEF